MARWKLRAPHYLMIPGTEYEYKEVDRATGRQMRMVNKVPRFLDPKDPQDWTHRQDEAIIVCHGTSTDGRDLTFEGPPTPDMDPIDDEAKKISASYSWKTPTDNDGAVSYGEMLVEKFLAQQAEIVAKQSAAQSISPGMVGMDKFVELQDRMATIMEQQGKMMEALLSDKKASGSRRPV